MSVTHALTSRELAQQDEWARSYKRAEDDRLRRMKVFVAQGYGDLPFDQQDDYEDERN